MVWISNGPDHCITMPNYTMVPTIQNPNLFSQNGCLLVQNNSQPEQFFTKWPPI